MVKAKAGVEAFKRMNYALQAAQIMMKTMQWKHAQFYINLMRQISSKSVKPL
jgi:RNase P subunit RPR2